MSAAISSRIAPSDIRRMLNLVSETSRLPDNPTARTVHALRGVMELTRSQVGVMARIKRTRGQVPQIQAFVDIGWAGAQERNAVVEAATQPGYVDPVLEGVFERADEAGKSARTSGRRDFFTDAEWYNSGHVAQVRKPGRIDECVYSIYPLPETGHYACLGLHRGWGDRTPFTERERQITDYVWQALGWLHASPMEAPREQPGRDLPPELAPAYRLLTSGHRLTGAARKLGLSPRDFRAQCDRVFTHFGVSSHLELLAKLAAR